MTATISPQQLNVQFGIPHTLRFESGPGGVPRAVITSDKAAGVVYLQGAQVAEFQPTGEKEVLFMSRESEFREGRPIRGGVPVCFPWFGQKGQDTTAPKHGLARTQTWDVKSAEKADDGVTLELTTRIDAFQLTHRVHFGDTLTMTLIVHNASQFQAGFEEMLHSYFSISQIRQVELAGLEGASYTSKVEGDGTQSDQPLTFNNETDRVYLNSDATCVIKDPGFARTVTIEKTNAQSTVVWNPWEDKAGRLDDFGDDEWPSMLCVESGNVRDNKIELDAGQTHEMSVKVSVGKL